MIIKYSPRKHYSPGSDMKSWWFHFSKQNYSVKYVLRILGVTLVTYRKNKIQT